jgi:FkbM family methyltransferase
MLQTALRSAVIWYIRHSPIEYKKGGMYTRLLERSVSDRPVTGVLRTDYGSRFHFTTADCIQRYLYTFGVWEPAISTFVSRRLRAGDTFIDIGANIGYFTLLASSLVGPTGSVVGIEASPTIFEALRANVELNGATNVRLVNMAAMGGPGEVGVFHGPAGNIGLTTIIEARGYPHEASVRGDALAAIASPAEIASARIIKIDVEGNEPDVVAGLEPVLSTTRPDLEIVLEVSAEADLLKRGHSQAAMLEPFEQAGFRAYVVDNRYEPWVYAQRRHSMRAPRLRAPLPEGGDLILARLDAEYVTI